MLDDSERAWIAEATRSLCAQLGISGVALERSAPAGSSEGQADHADRRLAAPPDTLDLDRLLRRAWREAFVAGGERIAVYGLGALTRLAMPTLTDLEPAPIAILDESRHVGGAALTSGPGMPQAIPVHHASRAGDLDLGAAVAMSFEYRDALLRQWTERWSAIPIVPLWRTACSASVGASTPSRMEASP